MNGDVSIKIAENKMSHFPLDAISERDKKLLSK
jgi:hypothetical protein